MPIEIVDIDDCRFYMTIYSKGCISALQIGTDGADLFIAPFRTLQPGEITELAEEAARANVDWVETFGPEAERIHDAIDNASVSIGRQSAVGDGSPMTAWHEELVTPMDVAVHVGLGGLGGMSQKIVLVLGLKHQLDSILLYLQSKSTRGKT